jgi:cell division protein FtsB
MADFRQRQRTRRLLYSKLTIAVLVVLVALSLREVLDIYQKNQKAKEAEAIAREQFAELERRSAFLESELSALQTPEGVEAKLRERFSIARPDEKVALLLADTATATVATGSRSWWQSLWSWIVH